MWYTIAWKFIKGVVKKIPWQVWVCAGVALAFWSWGELQYHRGAQSVQQEWDSAIERGKGYIENLKSKQGQTTEKVVTVYKDRIKVIHERGETITKLVPQYIPVGSCDLPGGFRLLHDAAATNSIPEAPGGVNDVPTSAQEVATTVAENYAACHKISAELISLQSWVQEQRQHYLDLCKQRGVVCSKDN